jgi:Gpi18-like mannosyltransferase
MRLKPIWYIVIAGFMLRLLFYLFGAAIYFGNEKFYIQGDTYEFFAPFYNLIEHGIFTTNLERPDALFGRMPGYPFLMGIFYFLAGKDVELGFRLLVMFQIFFDSFIIYILYKTAKNISDNNTISVITAVLYASYPFVIIWTSVAYAEIIGVNMAILSLYFSSRNHTKYGLLISGVFVALGSLFRPQIMFLTVSMSIALLIYRRKNLKLFFRDFAMFSIGFVIVFSAWPIRNYILSHELILTKKLAGTSRYMSADRLNFAYFMWAVKTDWEPQISQLINGDEVTFPKWVWQLSVEDSVKLRKVLKMSSECSDGFAQLKRLPKIPEEIDCTNETAALWEELRISVIKKAPLRYFVLVPLGNLKKAFFKSGLIKSYNRPDKPFVVNLLATSLFLYRTLLLIVGIAGLVFLFRQNHLPDKLLPAYYLTSFFVVWYLYLCFVYRDMDMRYLMPTDTVFLIPAAFFIYHLKIKKLFAAIQHIVAKLFFTIATSVNYQIAVIVVAGFTLRILFFLFGAEIYFGNEEFYIQGDTFDFFAPFQNLLNYGIFTLNFRYPDAVMGREPGFPFVMGFFYLISGKNINTTLDIILSLQILFDSLVIVIIYKTAFNIFRNHRIAILASVLYAVYPFIIVWTSVVYAETFGIHACILTIYFTTKERTFKNIFLAGVFAAVATFLRPQAVFLTVAFLTSVFISCFFNWREIFRTIVIFSVGFFAVYIWWPARNLLNYGEFELLKRVENAARSLSHDQLNFAYFMWSVKTDWEPQISQLLHHKKVEMPDWVWKMSQEDSVKLVKALELSGKCGDGFAQLRKQPKLPKEIECTDEVAALWKDLRSSVKKHEPLRYYLLVPLGNLKKALFKMQLIQSFNRPDKKPVVNLLVAMLFIFRTILILFGFFGAFIFFVKKSEHVNYTAIVFIAAYAVIWYFYLCFVYRDMDMRYLLPADALLLIPAAYFINFLGNKFFGKKIYSRTS